MSDVKIKMRDREPKAGQPCGRLTWRSKRFRAGETRTVSSGEARTLYTILAADGKPLFEEFVEKVEKAPEPEKKTGKKK